MTVRPEPLCHFGGRLYFTSFRHPAPKPDFLNNSSDVADHHPPVRGQPEASTSATPDDDAKYYYFTLDDQLHYLSFFQDWGPLNLAMVYKACILIHELLQDQDLSSYRLVLYSSSDPRRKANAALLIALYMLIVQHRPPWEAFHPIAEVEFMPFRDAGRGRSDFNLSIQDCLWGIWKAINCGLCDMNEFDVDDYEYYEKVENGDWNWLTPNFIAFASPVEPAWIKKERERRTVQDQQMSPIPPSSPVKGEVALQRKLPTPFQNCLDYFEKRGVKLVVRLNNPLYDRQHFLDRGVNHTELYFDDGTNPTDEIVRTFIDMADEVVEAGGVVAVHCKAGLGRTGTLIGAYLTWKYGFTAPEAIAFMRIVRPGSVVGPQQQYMYTKQLEWARWAAMDEMKKQRSMTLVTRAQIVAPATPPADSSSDDEMVIAELRATIQTTTTTGMIPIIVPSTPPSPPPKTPGRNQDVALATITPPGQPRKTPATKRNSNVLDSDSDAEHQEETDVLPALLPQRKVRPRPASSMASTRARGVTASEQRPMRVTRSTAAAAAAIRRPVRTVVTRANGNTNNAQAPPSKVPRYANGTSVRGTGAAPMDTKTAVNAVSPGAGVKRLRKPASPTPSRLPTLRRGNQNGNENTASGTQAANGKVKGKTTADGGDWMSTNAAAVVAPRSKAERPVLRLTRRRRSSFSATDAVA